MRISRGGPEYSLARLQASYSFQVSLFGPKYPIQREQLEDSYLLFGVLTKFFDSTCTKYSLFQA